MKKIINKMIENPKVAFLGRCLKHINDERFCREVFNLGRNGLTICFESKGRLNLDKKLYVIQFDDAIGLGMCALIRFTLDKLIYSEFFGFTPVVLWGGTTLYSEEEDLQKGVDAFSKYFVPIGERYAEQLDKSYMVAYSHISDKLSTNSYNTSDDELQNLSDAYKKYFVINSELNEYIQNETKKMNISTHTIGVHVRGTDYNKHFKNHPVVVTKEEYLLETKRMLDEYGYEKVFLATDEKAVVELFKRELGESVIYYKDVYRGDGTESVHGSNDSRYRHRYKLGCEVLRDVYTLSQCGALIAGLSNVPLLARIVKKSMGKEYRNELIIDHGTYTTGKNCSKKRMNKN